MIGIDNYLSYGSVKSSWVTIFILSIIYGVLYTVYPLFEESDNISDLETKRAEGGFLSRIGNSYRVVRDNMLMQLVALCFNAFGAASTKALSVLSWIFFIITVIYAIAVLFIDHKMIRVIFNLIFFVLTLIMSCLALKHGW